MKMIYLAVLVLVLISVPVYAKWKLVYETDFSSDPGWETNNPKNYYWDATTKSFFIRSRGGSGEYSTTKIPWNNESLRIEFDIKPIRVDFIANIPFGLFDADRNQMDRSVFITYYGYDGASKHVKLRAWGTDIDKWRDTRYDYDYPYIWYHHDMVYFKNNNTARLTIAKRETNEHVATIYAIQLADFDVDLNNLGISIAGFDANVVAEAYLDNVKYYVWEEYGTELFVNITGVAQTADGLNVVVDFYVEHEGKGVENLTGAEIFVDRQELVAHKPKNKGNGFYNVSFVLPKMVGNLNITLRTLYVGKTAEASAVFLHKIKHGKKVLLITDSSFWNNLYASVTGYPVIDAENKKQAEYFIGRYKPDNVFILGDVEGFTGYNVTNRNFLKEQLPGKGYVVVDYERKKATLGATVAALLDYRLTNSTNVSGNVLCTFNCSIPGAETLETVEKLENKIIDLVNETDYLALVNTNSEIAGLAPRFCAKRGIVPIVFDYADNSLDKNSFEPVISRINQTLTKIKAGNKLSADYRFDPVIYIILFGMPYGTVEDPAPELYNDLDGNVLYTDNFYGNLDDDPYQDAAVGRLASSVQAENEAFWDKKKDVLIIGEYRLPKVADLVSPCGMIEGFITERVLSLFDFDVKRIVEIRGIKIDANAMAIISERYGVWDFAKDYWFKYALDMIKPTSMLRLGSELKYSLLEYNWVETFRKMKPTRLAKISKTEVLDELPGEEIIFFFGVGNQSEWIMPKSVLNPYPDTSQKINAYDLNFKEPVFFFDEHSLSGHPDSDFVKVSNFITIGSTGIVHSAASVMPLLPFLRGITENKPVGYALKSAKNIVIFPEKNESVGNLITSSVTTGALRKMLKEHYQKILYGNPKIVIDPDSVKEEKSYRISDDLKLKITMNINSTLDNSLIDFESPDAFLMEYNKPVVPLYRISIPLPSNSIIKDLSTEEAWVTENNITIPILEPDEHYEKEPFSGVFPEQNIWASVDCTADGRQTIDISIVPVRYHNSTEYAEILRSINISLSYDAPLDILDMDVKSMWNSAEFKIRLKANGRTNVTVKIGDEIISQEFDIRGIEDVTLFWKGRAGKHRAIVVAGDGKNIAGPKYISFELMGFVGRIKDISGPESIFHEISTFESTFRLTIWKNASAMEYYETLGSLKITKNNGMIKKDFITTHGRLITTINATEIEMFLTTPNGWYRKTIISGSAKEEYSGETEEAANKMISAEKDCEKRAKLAMGFIGL
ncbi:MAG: hypothetical protein HZB66_01085 [Candidatus Aenigmarchaeota archaeon]|nr:hypothetical protein [Candidatus Aenigmarchaeota archaeon]